MADSSRDILSSDRDDMLPLGWVPGAKFRLTPRKGDHHRFYAKLFDGNPQEPLPDSMLMWDVDAEHRIAGIFINEDWTTVQFRPHPTTYPDANVWVRVRHLKNGLLTWLYRWWAANRQPR